MFPAHSEIKQYRATEELFPCHQSSSQPNSHIALQKKNMKSWIGPKVRHVWNVAMHVLLFVGLCFKHNTWVDTGFGLLILKSLKVQVLTRPFILSFLVAGAGVEPTTFRSWDKHVVVSHKINQPNLHRRFSQKVNNTWKKKTLSKAASKLLQVKGQNIFHRQNTSMVFITHNASKIPAQSSSKQC